MRASIFPSGPVLTFIIQDSLESCKAPSSPPRPTTFRCPLSFDSSSTCIRGKPAPGASDVNLSARRNRDTSSAYFLQLSVAVAC